MKQLELFVSTQSDKQRTQRYWSTSIHGRRQKTQPGHTFQCDSAPAHKLNPRDFSFQKGRKRGYNITSFTLRERPGWRYSCHSFCKTFPALGFPGSQSSLYAEGGGESFRFGEGCSERVDLLPSAATAAFHLTRMSKEGEEESVCIGFRESLNITPDRNDFVKRPIIK